MPFLIYTAGIPFLSTIPSEWKSWKLLTRECNGYQCKVGSKWFINISINWKTKLLFMLICACAISYRLVDEKLIKKIYEFVGEGVHQVIEMERHLEILVTNKVFVVLQCQVCLFCFFLSIKIFWIEIRTKSINCP